eukprot:TRINITY_DN2533_c0_g4_i1.p1 TRINITY_DN2533_c0_g4~~TRINITY_DN2533_c0_g4_i1.p1  ORF type:complete len:870 (-),score=360.98 TRINITY_DN2533_c0_g4_i1:6-2615(-)
MSFEIIEASGHKRANITDDGTVIVGNGVIAFLNDDGSAGDKNQVFLGDLDGSSNVRNASEKVIGHVHEAALTCYDNEKNAFVRLSDAGEILNLSGQAVASISPFRKKDFKLVVAYLYFVDPALVLPGFFSLVTGHQGKGFSSNRPLLIYDKNRAFRAKITSDGSVNNAEGTLLGFLNEDGSAGDHSERFLGDITNEGHVLNKSNVKIGSLNEAEFTLTDPEAALFAKITANGDIYDEKQQFAGAIEFFSAKKFRMLSGYLFFFDQALVKARALSLVVRNLELEEQLRKEAEEKKRIEEERQRKIKESEELKRKMEEERLKFELQLKQMAETQAETERLKMLLQEQEEKRRIAEEEKRKIELEKNKILEEAERAEREAAEARRLAALELEEANRRKEEAEREKRRLAEIEERRREEEERLEEMRRRAAEAEALRIAEETARRNELEEAKRVALEEARAIAEEAKRLAIEQARIEAEEEKKKALEEARLVLEETKRLAAEEAKKIAEEAKRLAAEEARVAMEEAMRQAEESKRLLEIQRMERAAQEEKANEKANEESNQLETDNSAPIPSEEPKNESPSPSQTSPSQSHQEEVESQPPPSQPIQRPKSQTLEVKQVSEEDKSEDPESEDLLNSQEDSDVIQESDILERQRIDEELETCLKDFVNDPEADKPLDTNLKSSSSVNQKSSPMKITQNAAGAGNTSSQTPTTPKKSNTLYKPGADTKTILAVALYDYTHDNAAAREFFSFKAGDQFTIIPSDKDLQGWKIAISSTGDKGFVPGNYLRYLEDEPKKGDTSASAAQSPASTSSPGSNPPLSSRMTKATSSGGLGKIEDKGKKENKEKDKEKDKDKKKDGKDKDKKDKKEKRMFGKKK